MLIAMTVTIPDPSTLQLPEFQFQPLWAWITGAVVGWYVLAALILRLIGEHKRNIERYVREVDDIKSNHLYAPSIAAAMSRLWTPTQRTATVLALSPVMIPLWCILTVGRTFVWLAGGTKPVPKVPEKDVPKKSINPTALVMGDGSVHPGIGSVHPNIGSDWVKWQEVQPAQGTKVQISKDKIYVIATGIACEEGVVYDVASKFLVREGNCWWRYA